MESVFYRCPHCGNIMMAVVASGVTPVCCGEPMQLLKANTVEASAEKHLPHVVSMDDHKVVVQVGSKEHPMVPEHHIQFVALESETGLQIVHLKPGSAPHAIFCIRTKPRAIYEYCNLHGLWKTVLDAD